MSRKRGVNTRSRLLCVDCAEVKKVSAINGHSVVLECGHDRPEILPLEPGHVSVEHMRTQRGQQLFPARLDGEKTTIPLWIEKHK